MQIEIIKTPSYSCRFCEQTAQYRHTYRLSDYSTITIGLCPDCIGRSETEVIAELLEVKYDNVPK